MNYKTIDNRTDGYYVNEIRPKLVRGGLALLLTVTPILYGCQPTRQALSKPTGIETINLSRDEAEYLKNYEAAGRPYLFEDGNATFEQHYKDMGWDTHTLTDPQIVQILRDLKDIVSITKGLK